MGGAVVDVGQHHTGEEVLAAVRAALDNVARHAGPGARAWLLLESTRGSVRVTVRDNGTGMAAERLAEAEAEGRLGATQSIRARMSDLGGSATWRSRPGAGCTVVLDVPVDAHQPI